MKKNFFLIGILLLALVLRVYKLASIPFSPYWEEAAIGYDAYSILQTGKDLHGNSFPILAFASFGDYKPSVYFYAVVPFIKLFGLDVLAVRLPSALAGVGAVWMVYLIGSLIYKKQVGFLAAVFYAIQPWSLQISRAGFETNLATFFVAIGIYLLLRAEKEKKTRLLLPAAVALGISMYTYQATRITAPLLGIAFGVRKQHFKQAKWLVGAAIIGVLFITPMVMNLKNPVVAQRAAETSIFTNIEIIKESNALQDADHHSIIGRLLHHRYVLFGERMIDQYFKNFSIRALFLEGDENPRHGTGEFGMLYHWEFFAILCGAYCVVRKKKLDQLAPIFWILIAGIPVAMTTVSPHALRFLAASPAFALLSAIGIERAHALVKKQWKVLFMVTFAVLVSVESFVYLHYYFSHYASAVAKEWQYGYKELYASLEKFKKPHQRVYVTREQGRPSIYYMFYTKQDPRYVQSQDLVVKKDQQELLELGDYRFVDALPLEKGALVASSPEKKPPITQSLQDIALPDGTIVWTIWEMR